MRRLISLLVLFLTGLSIWSQESYSLEGTVGTATDNPESYSLFLGGRIHFNTTLSAGIGLGLWNSGYASTWFEEYTNQTATLFRLSDNQTAPSFTVNLRGERPLITVVNMPLHVFVEPGVYFLPSTGRTVLLSENYFVGTPDPLTSLMNYELRSVAPTFSTRLVTDSKPVFGWELKGGLSLKVTDNVACSFSCAYQQVDLFRTLRNSTVSTHESNEAIELEHFFPNTGRIQLQVNFMYLFPLK